MAARDSYNQDPGRGDWDFDAVVEELYAPLFRFAMSLTRTEHTAADLVQDAFLVLAEKGRQLRDPAKVRAWLFTTLHRSFLRSQWRLSRFPEVEISGTEEELPVVDSGQVARLEAAEVLALLARVDDQYRGAVALFYLEDYSYSEIAEVLEVPIGTVKSRLARGLVQLKELVLRAECRGPAGKEQA